jgi:hypothetical protein
VTSDEPGAVSPGRPGGFATAGAGLKLAAAEDMAADPGLASGAAPALNLSLAAVAPPAAAIAGPETRPAAPSWLE